MLLAAVDAMQHTSAEISVCHPGDVHRSLVSWQLTRGFLVVNAITLGLFLIASHVARVRPTWASMLGFGPAPSTEMEPEQVPSCDDGERSISREDYSELKHRLNEAPVE